MLIQMLCGSTHTTTETNYQFIDKCEQSELYTMDKVNPNVVDLIVVDLQSSLVSNQPSVDSNTFVDPNVLNLIEI